MITVTRDATIRNNFINRLFYKLRGYRYFGSRHSTYLVVDTKNKTLIGTIVYEKTYNTL